MVDGNSLSPGSFRIWPTENLCGSIPPKVSELWSPLPSFPCVGPQWLQIIALPLRSCDNFVRKLLSAYDPRISLGTQEAWTMVIVITFLYQSVFHLLFISRLLDLSDRSKCLFRCLSYIFDVIRLILDYSINNERVEQADTTLVALLTGFTICRNIWAIWLDKDIVWCGLCVLRRLYQLFLIGADINDFVFSSCAHSPIRFNKHLCLFFSYYHSFIVPSPFVLIVILKVLYSANYLFPFTFWSFCLDS